MDFINNSGLEFKDISAEKKRTYDFGDGVTVVIDQPLKINVSDSGGHRIFDAYGDSHYIPAGWIHLRWTAKHGAPHFDF